MSILTVNSDIYEADHKVWLLLIWYHWYYSLFNIIHWRSSCQRSYLCRSWPVTCLSCWTGWYTLYNNDKMYFVVIQCAYSFSKLRII